MTTASSSTSSSERSWRRFLLTSTGLAAALALCLYAFVLVADPYDVLVFSPPAERAPVTKNRRYTVPGIARRADLDSFIVGTSTAMLLHPERLGQALGGRFGNLAIPAASPYEQQQVLQLIARRHPRLRTLLIGVDEVWCDPNGAAQFLGVGTLNPFPAWLYDDNPWNDLPPLTDRSLRHAGRQAATIIGWRPAPYHRNGFHDFTASLFDAYDLQRARRKIYDQRAAAAPLPPIASWRFPDLQQLGETLQGMPDHATKLLVFMPYHKAGQGRVGSKEQNRWARCKQQAADMARQVASSLVIDLMIDSAFTRSDSNYWDHKHYTAAAATQVEDWIAQAALQPTRNSDAYRLLR